MIFKFLNNFDTPENRKLLIKYIIISFIGYSFVFFGLYFLVDVFQINTRLAFIIIYALSYLLLYYLQLKILFKRTHSMSILVKFISSIAIFYILANILFTWFMWMTINYLIATGLIIVILMPVRFLVSKFLVFKK